MVASVQGIIIAPDLRAVRDRVGAHRVRGFAEDKVRYGEEIDRGVIHAVTGSIRVGHLPEQGSGPAVDLSDRSGLVGEDCDSPVLCQDHIVDIRRLLVDERALELIRAVGAEAVREQLLGTRIDQRTRRITEEGINAVCHGAFYIEAFELAAAGIHHDRGHLGLQVVVLLTDLLALLKDLCVLLRDLAVLLGDLGVL